MIYKFRIMRMDTLHDMPTHMMADLDQYITRTEKFMRKYSIDENVIIGQNPETLVKTMAS